MSPFVVETDSDFDSTLAKFILPLVVVATRELLTIDLRSRFPLVLDKVTVGIVTSFTFTFPFVVLAIKTSPLKDIGIVTLISEEEHNNRDSQKLTLEGSDCSKKRIVLFIMITV